jgi:hypothetical protein
MLIFIWKLYQKTYCSYEVTYIIYLLSGLSSQENYTDRVTAACRRS